MLPQKVRGKTDTVLLILMNFQDKGEARLYHRHIHIDISVMFSTHEE